MRRSFKLRKDVVLMVLALALSLVTWTQLGATHVRADEIQANVNVDPDSLLLKEEGYGKWMTAYIGLPEGYKVDSIDVSSVTINVVGVSVPVLKHSIQEDTLMVKFDRAYVVSILWSMTQHMSPHVKEEVAFEVSGQMYDGPAFKGSDTVSVFYV